MARACLSSVRVVVLVGVYWASSGDTVTGGTPSSPLIPPIPGSQSARVGKRERPSFSPEALMRV